VKTRRRQKLLLKQTRKSISRSQHIKAATLILLSAGLLIHPAAHGQEVTPDALSTPITAKGVENISFNARVERPDEELLIFELRLGNIPLSDAIVTYEDIDTGNYLIPLSDFFDALEFPITVDNEAGTADGWATSQEDSFALSLPDGTVSLKGTKQTLKKGHIEKHDDGIYVSISTLQSWFPVTIDVNFSDLALIIKSLQPLPIETRLARDKDRGELNTKGRSEATPNALEKPDAPSFTLPFFDTSLQSSYTNRDDATKSLGLQFSTVARSIILGQDALYSINDQTSDDQSPDVRLTIGRKAFEDDTLYSGIKEYAVGDVTTYDMPLIADNNAGRGAFFTNISPFKSSLGGSDTYTLRGALQVGYQVDIKRNGELIDFVEAPDANGEYVFDDLFVLPGLNVFELVFYGPQGQEIVEERRIYIPENPIEEGAFEYRFHAIQDNTNLLTNRDDNDEDTGKVRLTGEATYGLTKLSSIRVGAAGYSLDGNNKQFGLVGFNTSWKGLRFDLNQALSAEGKASSARVESIFKGFRWQLQHQFYDNFISEDNNQSSLSGDLEHESNFRVSGILPFAFLKNIPLTLQTIRLQNTEGDEQYEWNLRATKNIDRFRITSEIDQAIPPASDRETNLNFQISSRFNDFTLRGVAQYSLEPETLLQSLNLTSDITLDEQTKLRLGISRSGAQDPIHAATIGLNRDVGFAQIGFNTTYDDDSNVTALLSASFGFAYDKQRKSPYFSSNPLSNSSALFAKVYRDLNSDNVIDDDEPLLEDISFTLSGNQKEFVTKKDGSVFIPELRSFDRTTVEIREATFPNPFMKSPPSKIDYQMRPSQTYARNYPVVLTGEVDGNVSIFKNGSKIPAASIMLDIQRADEKVTFGKSEFDGFFLIQDIPEGNYTIQPNEAQLNELGYCSIAPQNVILTAEEPFYSVENEFILFPAPDLIQENLWLVIKQSVPLEEALQEVETLKAFNISPNEDQVIDGKTEDSLEENQSLEESSTIKVKTPYLYKNDNNPDLASVILGPYSELESVPTCAYFKDKGLQCEDILKLECDDFKLIDINRAIKTALPEDTGEDVIIESTDN
jgi:hypothetical protein